MSESIEIEMPNGDKSGCPPALIELARRQDDLAVCDNDRKLDVLFKYPPIGKELADLLGYTTFVKLRTPVRVAADGGVRNAHYALVK